MAFKSMTGGSLESYVKMFSELYWLLTSRLFWNSKLTKEGYLEINGELKRN